MLYKGSLCSKKGTHFQLIGNIHTLSQYILWSSNLTIWEPFLKNNSDGRFHYFCTTVRTLLLAGCSYIRRHRITASVYPRFSSSHLSSLHPTIGIICGKSIIDTWKRWLWWHHKATTTLAVEKPKGTTFMLLELLETKGLNYWSMLKVQPTLPHAKDQVSYSLKEETTGYSYQTPTDLVG